MPEEPKPGNEQPGALKHPAGLYTLFFTEMWERFSYYGMRALLALFMIDAIEDGGLGFNDEVATSIYGLYTALVYMVAVPGGWVADRLLGAQRSVWYGGIIIAAGHFTLAIPGVQTFFLGLLLVILGTGLLKPNISAIVGQLYPEGGARRDAGFTIFYMGINLGAAAGPLVCSWLGENVSWHYGFGAAGIGMLLGLIQYKIMAPKLGDAGLYPTKHQSGSFDRAWLGVWGCLGLVGLVVLLALTGRLQLNPVALNKVATYVIVGLGIAYFIGLFLLGGLKSTEKRHLSALIVLLIAAAIFWSGFEQAGSSLNIFAERLTERTFNEFTIPAGWFQSLNPVYILIFAPVVASVWVSLARWNMFPSIPAKFAIGLLLLAGGFVIMIGAVALANQQGTVMPTWLITTYLLHTLGELCLSPVGLSAVTKLSPQRYVSQMMGLWFLASALGSLIAGLIATQFVTTSMTGTLIRIIAVCGGSGLLLLLFSRPLHKLMDGIR